MLNSSNPFTLYLQDQMTRRANESYLGSLIYNGALYLHQSEDRASAANEVATALQDELYLPHGATALGIINLIVARFNLGMNQRHTKKDEDFRHAA